MGPKNLEEELGLWARAFTDRTWDFDRRARSIHFLEGSTCSLNGLKAFVRDSVLGAPRIYCQVKKVIDEPDKPLPLGDKIPEDCRSLRVWSSHQETVAAFQHDAAWM